MSAATPDPTPEPTPATAETEAPADASGGGSTVVWGIAAVLIVGILFAAMQLAGKAASEPKGRSALVPPNDLELLDRRVLERSGEEMTTHQLVAKGFAVVNFMFTNCPGPCPPLSQAMLELQEATKDMDDVQLGSFTVDPRRDDVAALSTYADRIGADPEKWKFLFTNEGTVHQIAFDGLGVGHKSQVIAHSNKFILLDHEAKARAFYEPLKEQDWLQVLLADIERLRAESPGSTD